MSRGDDDITSSLFFVIKIHRSRWASAKFHFSGLESEKKQSKAKRTHQRAAVADGEQCSVNICCKLLSFSCYQGTLRVHKPNKSLDDVMMLFCSSTVNTILSYVSVDTASQEEARIAKINIIYWRDIASDSNWKLAKSLQSMWLWRLGGRRETCQTLGGVVNIYIYKRLWCKIRVH